MPCEISVILPTHNPREEYLRRTLDCLSSQNFETDLWELLIVDNASEKSLELSNYGYDESEKIKIIKEDEKGLTNARIAGLKNIKGKYVVFVDDDNLLDKNYLLNVYNIFNKYNNLGVIGGKSIPEFEKKPEEWVKDFYKCLALRDLGDKQIISKFKNGVFTEYPDFAPIGAGMALRKEAIQKYLKHSECNSNYLISDRIGENLSSGGDNDIVLSILKNGYEVGYFPELELTHIIPEFRTTKEYLAKLNHDSFKSWILVLDKYDICPWSKIPKWTVLPRKIKSFFQYKPWKNPESYIKWYGVCGQYEGRSDIN